jgi:hypothetical protein
VTEALAHFRYYNFPVSQAMPRGIVALGARLARVRDLTGGGVRRVFGVSVRRMLKEPWRDEQKKGREALTQAIGRLAQCSGPALAVRAGAPAELLAAGAAVWHRQAAGREPVGDRRLDGGVAVAEPHDHLFDWQLLVPEALGRLGQPLGFLRPRRPPGRVRRACRYAEARVRPSVTGSPREVCQWAMAAVIMSR